MVPAHKQRCLDKCLNLGADALVFDLEDSVPVGMKSTALHMLRKFLQESAGDVVKPFVRVNPSAGKEEVAALRPWIYGVMLPKVEQVLPCWCASYPTLLVIETAMAVLHLEELFRESNVIGGVFGIGDYSADMGVIDRPWIGDVNTRFAFAKQKLATVARAYDKMAIDTSFFVKGLNTEEETRRQWLEVAGWGFTGASPIHPAQIPIANEVFSTSPREQKWSTSVIKETQRNENEVYVDSEGFVVGPPHLKQAKGRV